MRDDLSVAEWRDDLDWLAEAVRREHVRYDHSVSPERFRAATRALRARIPALAAHEIMVELALLLALIGDGHTALRLPSVPWLRRMPVRVDRFADGIVVTAIDADRADLAGGRVIAINGVPVLDVWDRLRPIVSRDNEMGALAQVPGLLVIPEVLHAAGIVPTADRATWTVLPPGQPDQRVEVELLAGVGGPTDLVDVRDRAGASRRNGPFDGDRNDVRLLPDGRTLALSYVAVRDAPEESLAALFERLFEAAEHADAQRLVIDIRRNGGGNMALNRPLVEGLIRSERFNRWGGLFVIAGRQTFSAAMNLAVDLERWTRALFVGEPTGSSPNHYGENVDLTLPVSGLRATVSSLWWQTSLPFDDRPWIAPDLPAYLTAAQFATGHDPALAAIDAVAPDTGGYGEPGLHFLGKLRQTDPPRR